MIFLGTGASEMIPNPMCGCDVCRRALASTDPRDKRCRSAFLYDGTTLIDCGPDVLGACGRFGVSLRDLKRIFITHTHSDHFAHVTLENLQMCITEAPEIEIYVSPAAYEGMQRLGKLMLDADITHIDTWSKRWPNRCTFLPFEPFREYQFEDGLTVSAVIGRHVGEVKGEESLNYLFEKDGSRLFYASDTGVFYPETFTYLQGKTLDTLVIECAFGKREIPRDKGHLYLATLYEMIESLAAQGTVTSSTRIFVTHVGHKGGMLHEELDAELKMRYGDQIAAAYDGLRI